MEREETARPRCISHIHLAPVPVAVLIFSKFSFQNKREQTNSLYPSRRKGKHFGKRDANIRYNEDPL